MGLVIFLIIIRASMLVGWWEVITKPSEWMRSRRLALPFFFARPTVNDIEPAGTSLKPLHLLDAPPNGNTAVDNGRTMDGNGLVFVPFELSPTTRSDMRPTSGLQNRTAGTSLVDTSTARRTMIRDPSDRKSAMRIETESEALSRLRGFSGAVLNNAGNRESMVLGEEIWPGFGKFSIGDGEGPDADEDYDALGNTNDKSKGKEARRSRFEERKGSWMGEGWNGVEADERPRKGSGVSVKSRSHRSGSVADETRKKSLTDEIHRLLPVDSPAVGGRDSISTQAPTAQDSDPDSSSSETVELTEILGNGPKG